MTKKYIENKKEAQTYNPFHNSIVLKFYFRYVRPFILNLGQIQNTPKMLKTQKSATVMLVVLLTATVFIQSLLYNVYGMNAAPISISLGYVVCNIILLAMFGVTRKYRLFFSLFHIYTLVFLVVMTLLLGGLTQSGFILVLGIILPLSANFSRSITIGAITVLGYAVAIAVIALNVIFDFLPISDFIIIPEMPPHAHIVFFSVNMISIMFLIYASSAYLHLNHLFHREQSELLLENVLPTAIVQRIKNVKNASDDIDETFSEYHEDVVVLFADMSGFSQFSSKITPTHLIQQLNAVFSQFDIFADKHHIEKIKTIGDAYMAIAKPMEYASHYQRMTEFAFDVVEFTKSTFIMGWPIKIRIGMHVGDVITGVVGVDKLSYDVWGTTVNVASRIEHYAPSSGITVSEDVYKKIYHAFSCTNRRIEVLKGIGEMRLWDVIKKY